MASLLILNGPNLNLLGTRQPEVYGSTTLSDIEAACLEHGRKSALNIVCEQTNSEGGLVDLIHSARGQHTGLIINAGAYTHTSIAIMDAVFSVELPTVEVHLSNIHSREDFRHKSYLTRAAVGQIAGFGLNSYILAIDALKFHLEN